MALFRKDKKLKYALLVISFIALISGMLFIRILNSNDLTSLEESLNIFIDNLGSINYLDGLKNSLITNFIYIFIIWSLGISIIGIPIVLFMYFIKVFTLGFSLASIMHKYGIKGIIYGFGYIFPHNVFLVILLAFLVISSIKYSFSLTDKYLKKESFNFLNNNYRKTLFISIIGIIVISLYNTYIMPYVFKMLLKL